MRCRGAGHDCFETPVDKRIDGFKPGHAKDHRVNANWGNEEGLGVRNAGDGKIEGDLAVRVCEGSTVSKTDFDRRTGLNRKTQAGH